MQSTSQNAGLTNQTLANNYNNLNTQAGYAQNLFGNRATGINTLSGLYNGQNSAWNSALNSQAGLSQQALTNTLGANTQNAGIYGALISNANLPITIAATAQQSAQQPALNLWNAALGANNTTAGTYSALAASSPTTTSTSNGSNGWTGALLPIAMGLMI